MSISNNENTEQMSILYNKVALAEKLDDLRHEKGLSLSKLSSEIETKTGVSISATQLGKYENPQTTDIIGLNNLLALANYYDKSIYYLLGMNECENVDNEAIFKRLGFKDDTINFFENMNIEDKEYVSIVNILLGSKDILKEVKEGIDILKSYIKAISNNHLEIDINYFSKLDIQIEDDIEKINEFLKHEEDMYLFKLSETANKIAKLLKTKYEDSTDKVIQIEDYIDKIDELLKNKEDIDLFKRSGNANKMAKLLKKK